MLNLFEHLRERHPGLATYIFGTSVAVIVISAHENPVTIRRSLDYGASGYLTKRTGLADLKSSLNAVLSCQEWLPATVRKSVAQAQLSPADHTLDEKLASLSPQQFKVLTRVTRGLLNKQIADELGYANPSALSRVFSQRVGMSPRDWLKQSG